MSQLLQYINSLPDTSFEAVKAHFEAQNMEVKEEGPRYMLLSPTIQTIQTIQTGTILTKDTNCICCVGFPSTVDALENRPTEPGPFVVTNYLNGTLIRAYYASDCWKLSTNRVMNAYDSFWGSKMSFADMLDDCLQEKFSKSSLAAVLNTQYSYQFIVQHPKDAFNHQIPLLFHIGTFNNTTLQYVHRDEVLHHPKVVSAVTQEHTFETFEKIQEFVHVNQSAQGVIFFPQGQETTVRYKLLNPTFQARRNLLGNTPNFHLRYLECLAAGSEKHFLYEFPHMLPLAIAVQQGLLTVMKDVHALYMEKYIKQNKLVPVLFAYRPILYALHGYYMKTHQKITKKIVSNTLYSYHPRRQFYILNSVGLI